MTSGLLDLFDHCYIINLPARTDRKAEMVRQLARLGVDLNDPRITLFPAFRPGDPGAFPSIGARGCFESHIAVLRLAASNGFGRLLIFEDDLDFEPDFAERLGPMRERLGSDEWGMFYGGHRLQDANASEPRDNLLVLPPEFPVQSTHFVAFQGEAIGRLVGYLAAMKKRPSGDPAGGPMHVDGAYNWFRRENPDVMTLAARPPLGHQRSSRSDIADLTWKDRAPIVRDLVSTLRRVRNR